MAAVGYATLPVVPGLKGFSQKMEKQLGPQMDKFAKQAGERTSKAIGDSISKLSRELAKARDTETAASKAAAKAERDYQKAVNDSATAVERVEKAERDRGVAAEKAAAAEAAALARVTKLKNDQKASVEQVEAAEAKLQAVRAQNDANIANAEDRYQQALRKSAEAAEKATVKEGELTKAKRKAREASEDVLSKTKQLDNAQTNASKSGGAMATALSKITGESTAAGRALGALKDKANGIGSSITAGFKTMGKGALLGVGAKAATTFMDGVNQGISGGMARLQSVEQAEKMLLGLGNSAEKVDTIMDNAMKSVKGTAYGFGDAAKMAATFVGANVQEGEELTRVLKLVGDTAAITGSDFADMGAIWTKVAANQKVTTEELNQLQDRGLGLLTDIQKKYNVTADEARKMISEGKVSFEDFAEIMESKVGGAAQEMGDTFGGSAANMRASLSRLGETFLKPGFALAPVVFKGITEGVDAVNAKMKPLVEEISERLMPYAERIAQTIGPLIVKTADLVGDGFVRLSGGVKVAADHIGRFVEGVQVAAREVKEAFQGGDWGFGQLAEVFGESNAQHIVNAAASLGSAFREVKDFATGVVDILWKGDYTGLPFGLGEDSAFVDHLFAIREHAIALGDSVGDFLGSVGDLARALWDSVGPLAAALWESLKAVGEVVFTLVAPAIGLLTGLFTDTDKSAEGASKNGVTLFLDSIKFVTDSVTWLADNVLTPTVRLIGDLAGKFAESQVAVDLFKASLAAVGTAYAAAKIPSMVSGMASLAVQAGKAAVNLGRMAAASVVKGIGALVNGIKGARGAMVALNTAMAANPIMAVAAAIAAVTAGLVYFFTKTETGKKMWADFTGFVSEKFTALADGAKATWDSVTTFFTEGYNNYVKPVFEGLVEIGKWAFQIIATAVLTPLVLAWEALAWAFKGAYDNIIKPVIDGFASAMTWLYDNAVRPVIDFVVGKWNELVSAFQTGWVLVRAVFDFFGQKAQELWGTYVSPVFQAIADGWNFMAGMVQVGWWLIRDEVFGRFAEGISSLWQNYVSPVTDWIAAKWDWLKTMMIVVKDAVVGLVFAKIEEGLDKLKSSFQLAVDGIRFIWDQVKAITAKPARFVVETVYNNGIRKAWGLVSRFTGLDPLPEADLGHLGAYASGGVLPGYTPGRDIYNMIDPKTGLRVDLGGGEAIMRPEFTAVVGKDSIDALNRAARQGGKAGVAKMLGEGAQFAYARGGVFPNGDTEIKEDQARRIERAVAFMEREDGKPYQWGGVGDPSWDCSGLWSGIVHELNGRDGRSGRQFNTTSLMANPSAWGFVRGLSGPITVGVSNDHMAGTLAGTNAESRGGDGVLWGRGAWGSTNGYFPNQYTLASFLGEFMPGAEGGSTARFNPLAMAKGLWDGVIDKIGAFPGADAMGLIGQMPGAFLKKAAGDVWAFLTDKISSVTSFFSGDRGSAGSAESWRDMAMWAMRREGFNADDPAQVNAMLAQIMSESGGNPGIAQQIVDINGTGESAGVGLLQIIPGTFASHRDPSLPNDRRDPEANMVAALRYYKSRYGTDLTTTWGHGHGYASGGVLPGYTPGRDVHRFWSPTAGGLALSGGEAIMVPEWTKSVGGPAAVEQMNRAARGGRAGSGSTSAFAAGGVFTARYGDPVGRLVDAADALTAELERVADPTTLEGIAARAFATQSVDILGSLGANNTAAVAGSLLTAESNLYKAREDHLGRLDDIAAREEDLAAKRRELAALQGEKVELSVKDQRKLADAEDALAKARAESEKAATKDGDAAEKSKDKIAKAEEKLRRVQEDIGIKSIDDEEKRADAIEKAQAEIVKSEDELLKARKASAAALDVKVYDVFPQLHDGLNRAAAQAQRHLPQVAGALSGMAAMAGPAGASVGMAVQAVKSVIDVVKTVWGVIEKITDWFNGIRIKTTAAVYELTGAWVTLTDQVEKYKQGVAELRMQWTNAALELIGRTIDLRAAQADVVRAQLQGAKSVREAERALQEERDKVTKSQVWNFRDLSLEYDRLRYGVRDLVAEQEDGLNVIHDLALEDLLNRADGIAALTEEQRLALAEQLAGEQAARRLAGASLSEQLRWQDMVNKAKAGGLEAELKAVQAVTPEILALQYEVYRAQKERDKNVLEAQIKSLQASYAQQRAMVTLTRLGDDLIAQQQRLDQMTGKTMGMDHGQAVVQNEIARLLKENAEIMGQRNSAGAKARNFFGRMFDWNGDGNGGTNTWSVERKQYDAQIAANQRQIDELMKSKYAGAWSPGQQAEVDKAIKLASRYFAQGNEAAAKATLEASPLGIAKQALEVNAVNDKLFDWEKSQTELARKQQDNLQELIESLQLMPMQQESAALDREISANTYASEALRETNAGVRDALRELNEFENAQARSIRSDSVKNVLDLTLPASGDTVQADDALRAIEAIAEQFGIQVGRIDRLEAGNRTTATDRVKVALGRY